MLHAIPVTSRNLETTIAVKSGLQKRHLPVRTHKTSDLQSSTSGPAAETAKARFRNGQICYPAVSEAKMTDLFKHLLMCAPVTGKTEENQICDMSSV